MDIDKKTELRIGEDFSMRFADIISRHQIDDLDWERELIEDAEKAFHWAINAEREREAETEN